MSVVYRILTQYYYIKYKIMMCVFVCVFRIVSIVYTHMDGDDDDGRILFLLNLTAPWLKLRQANCFISDLYWLGNINTFLFFFLFLCST